MITAKEFHTEGHWFTCYPALNYWGPVSSEEYERRLGSFLKEDKPTELYVHIPFCKKLCYYCLCNLIITSDREKIKFFLKHLFKEIDNLKSFHENPNITEIHLGGGTPSYLDRDEFADLCRQLWGLVEYSRLREVAMEIDPRTVEAEDVDFYASEGVTRVSFGIQDFDPGVQKAINREQPPEMVEKLMGSDKLTYNFDLLYGLPLQTHKTVEETLQKVRQLDPDRITLLKYCHVPDVRKHMKLIEEKDLPNDEDIAQMFVNIVNTLVGWGYKWIGLDHFAKPTDDLALATNLHRTFNGFTPGRAKDLVCLGPTGTGAFGQTYVQAPYDLNDYYNSVNQKKLPVFRGYQLSYDDCLRRDVIFDILCKQNVDFNHYGNYFNKELTVLADSDLCDIKNGVLTATPKGRYLLRSICKIFDSYPEQKKVSQFNITRKVRLVA